MNDPNHPCTWVGGNLNPKSMQAISKGQTSPQDATNHYVGWVVGEFIHKLSLGFLEGNIVKYVCRYKKKNGKADLLKAREYIDKLIELEYPD